MKSDLNNHAEEEIIVAMIIHVKETFFASSNISEVPANKMRPQIITIPRIIEAVLVKNLFLFIFRIG